MDGRPVKHLAIVDEVVETKDGDVKIPILINGRDSCCPFFVAVSSRKIQ
jgi:hypothetical protein